MDNETKIASIARKTIQIEIEALERLKATIGPEFCEVVTTILRCQGRVVVTGIGKSALVGKKVVATLNSTGTQAVFMHAADAIHGDLGMINPNDLLLCLSKSGETAEIKVLVPLLRQLGNRLIGMCCRADSYLGQQADYCLLLPVDREADPHNLAPTASTTAQMAMGDALAVALLELRGFSPRDFAQVHPGGALGRQLYLRVRDLYPRNARPAVAPDDNLRQTIMEMTSKRLGATVVEAEGRLLGIITDGDLRRMLEQTDDFSTLRAADIMSPTPKTIDKDELAVEALQVLRSNSITQLVVTDEGQYVGIIHLHDLLREGIV
ncbi:MAG: KpsF/GutQ family sugar-phosphate isomerase [Bacteroidota bacterium]